MDPALMTGKVVDTMRNDHAPGQAGNIMIKRFEGLLAVYLAIPIERSQVVFLLGINAQDRVARREKLLHEMGQMAKLRITMRRVAAGQHLEHVAPGNTTSTFNYAPIAVGVVLLYSGGYWFLSARNWFKGPKVQGSPEELARIEKELEAVGG